jgi:hypothetical protein
MSLGRLINLLAESLRTIVVLLCLIYLRIIRTALSRSMPRSSSAVNPTF